MDDAIERIYQALLRRELDDADLSARRIASFLDRTTGSVYHHWGSVDGLLFAVSQRGFVDLGARLTAAWSKAESLVDCAEAYVTFGLENPEIYPLMFERRFDWAALRAAGAFAEVTPGSGMLRGVLALLGEAGSTQPLADARILMTGLHGIVSLAQSGRMNTGELTTTDRDVALATARDLATRICSSSATRTGKKKR